MSQRDSGYDRIERDAYFTPEWVTQALIPHMPKEVHTIMEPACGAMKMVLPLRDAGFVVDAYDIESGSNFFERTDAYCDAIITNPPYVHATEFVEHALHLMQPNTGVVAMLLRTDFDHAKTRAHLFANHSAFSKKLVLTKRITWFEEAGRKAAPSYNHAWFIWDWANYSAPVIAYDIQGAA